MPCNITVMLSINQTVEPWMKFFKFVINHKILRSVLILLSFFTYCEIFHYTVVLLQCTWPAAPHTAYSTERHNSDIKVSVIADTHLLGYRHGHWFDKLRREWQMKQAFQTSMLIHKPDVVFVLGDLLDEGKWCDDEEFLHHVARFKKMFAVPEGTQLHVVSGNHDEGFHYMMSDHKHERFEHQFKSPSVRMVEIKNNIFVLVNSMAMEGDGCSICVQAESALHDISHKLNLLKICDQKASDDTCKYTLKNYTRPIILQHFPMYRKSDSDCNTDDAAPPEERNIPFRPKLDSLDQRSTNMLFSLLDPRLVMSAHTHHGCYILHHNTVPEWTVSSFSWRNRNDPTLLLVRMNNFNHSVTQCFLPKESTVVNLYILAAVVAFISLLWPTISYKYRQKMC
ncbi:unnamed protein product [Lymnaea stagnalis]|uniref:Calcineurin-like phosphoesterase domain-containing protein n=1 Tax=Lymnaea stagnalis TaxID=6523 RepID=A0AAV2H321_LYMST